MSEIKAVSFRLGDEEVQKFREFAEEQGLNQAEMFQALVNNFEVARAKNLISDRAKEIETFQATVNTLVGMFVNSLAINHSSEERMRDVLSVELGSKDKIIADLQFHERDITSRLEDRERHVVSLLAQVQDLTNRVSEYKEEIQEKNSLLADYKIQKNMLATMVDEYKPYKEECEARRAKYEELAAKMEVTQRSIAELQFKLKEVEKMRDFYKNDAEGTKAELKAVSAEAKETAQSHKKEIKDLQAAHAEEMAKLRLGFEETLKNRVELETAKLQIEVSKLQLRLEKAKTPSKK